MLSVSRGLIVASLVILAVLVNARPGEAQTFRFRVEPFCNVVTLALIPSSSSSIFGVVGYDDDCGESTRSATIHGTAFVNRNGSVTIGYTTILPYSEYQRSDVGYQTSVEFPANSNVGTWMDDEGGSGTFEFNILDQKSG